MANKRVREDETQKRVPLHEQKKDILTVPQKEGFVRRFVNDYATDPGQRIARFLKAGWKVVDDESRVGTPGVENPNQSIGTGVRKYVGGGITAVLMEIEQELYDEDQESKAERQDEIEKQIFRGDGVEGRYGKIEKEDGFVSRKKK